MGVGSKSSARPWWQDAVIYQVYPRSFQDSNGDGVGDLKGIIERADYFAWLGVEAVWFSPFFTSPMADFGYDISNYLDIDPSFGTLADFDRLVGALHARNIRVILDYVPNHTSDQHPWFMEFAQKPRQPQARLVLLARSRRGRRAAEQLAKSCGRKLLGIRCAHAAILLSHLPQAAMRFELAQRRGSGRHA